MLDEARRPDVMDDETMRQGAPDDIRRVGCALVQLDAWCRQRGLEELALLIAEAAAWADERVTRP